MFYVNFTHLLFKNVFNHITFSLDFNKKQMIKENGQESGQENGLNTSGFKSSGIYIHMHTDIYI